MSSRKRLFTSFAIFAVAALGVMGLSGMISGEGTTPAGGGFPDDWSHHHVVFTDPGTAAEALAQGHLAEWYHYVNDPRYQIQKMKRSLMQRRVGAAPDFTARTALLNAPTGNSSPAVLAKSKKVTITKDWSMNVGNSGGADASQTGTVSGTPTTANGQTLVITNGATSLTLTATPSVASASATFTGRAGTGQTLRITNGTHTLILTAGTTNSNCSSGTDYTATFNRGTTGSSASWAAGIISVLGAGSQCATNIGVTASGTSPALTLTANTSGTGGNSITITDGLSNITLPASLSGGTNATDSGTDFSTSSTPATEATHIENAINVAGNGSSVGVSATANGDEVTVTATTPGTGGNSITLTEGVSNFSWTGGTLSGGTGGTPGTMGPGQYPAKYSFNATSASCSDYVVYPTGLAGGTSQATIVAYTNLYASAGCGGTIPTIDWAYNTGTGATATLSPVLSLDGTQVAFVQTISGTASLVLLKPSTSSGGTITGPATITFYSNSTYHACAAPCYTTLSLGAADTNSAPYYNYGTDVMYVGDNSGNLHEFTTVLNGPPAAGWTTKVTGTETATVLTSPVVDPNSGLILVSDSNGYVHSLSAAGGSEATAEQNDCGTAGFTDAPLVDSSYTNSYVYVFISYGCDTGNHAYINVDEVTALSTTSYGTYIQMGTGSTAQKVYAGSFDNQHTTSNNGNLYVCMGDETDGTHPTLFQIGLGTGGGGVPTLTRNVYNTVSSAAATCSPVTEFYNSSDSTDWVFLSVTASGESVTGCTTGACLYNYAVPANTTTHTGTPSAGIATTLGSTAIVIDNNGPAADGESQIYYGTLGSQACTGTTVTGSGTGGCAVQASQSAP